MMCPRCIARGKRWEGGDPRCAFEGGVFSAENWNCATAGAIRELVEGDGFGTVPAGVSAAFSEDTTAVLVPIELDTHAGRFLLVSWYKRRGRTDVIAIVGGPTLGATDSDVVPLPLAAAEEVIAHLERTLLGVVPTPPGAVA